MTHTPSPSRFENVLAQVLISSEENNNFSSSEFFKKWFLGNGSSYFFLFKKNLKVTNIQFAELLALIRTYTTPTEGNEHIRDLLFRSTSEFNDAINGIVAAFSQDSNAPDSQYELIAKLYSSLLCRTIVVDCFFGSCVVFVPPELKIDLLSICAYSGYIHSCGDNVFIRRISKTNKEDFFNTLKKYLDNKPKDGKCFFSVYAHEDFTDYDRPKASELRSGLDDVKIFVEKFYMGSERLVSILKEMRKEFKEFLEIPEPGDYNSKHKEFREQSDVDTSQTLWLIIDHCVSEAFRNPGEERYFICYNQQFINENPFHLFDENKPAWIAHTTIPHTLMGAMINITKPQWSTKDTVVLADPFAGTGTTFLEALKFANVSVKCSDIESIAPLLAADNLKFFSLLAEELEKFKEKLSRLVEILSSTTDSEPGDSYSWAVNLLKKSQVDNNADAFSFSLDIVKELKSKTLFDRLLFYLALRTNLRNIAAFEREAKDWKTAYRKEASNLKSQIENLCKLRMREQTKNEQRGNFSVFHGSYSLSCSMSSGSLVKFLDDGRIESAVKVQDAKQLEQKSCDIIVTDPPYGFNTDDDPKRLAKQYVDFINSMIFALKDNGQLVLCLPDHSHTGRQLPFFVHKELITQQILVTAEMAGLEIVNPAYAVPLPRGLFQAPYYWESERALRRAILHFRFRASQ